MKHPLRQADRAPIPFPECIVPFSPRIPSSLYAAMAAQYVRMSTEHQQYSPENQADVITRYAASHGLRIVRTYSDHGRSGLNLSGREGLQKLLEDVQRGTCDYSAVLVYDVSRWGRFQDVDESAYYEYILKRANISVHYCAEQFENDGSIGSTLLKTVKRTMAGEYSRELSVKVFAGQCRLIELGFRQGGNAGYGLRRQLVDQRGAPKTLLSRGERKSIQTDRVVLVPGPESEIAVVREVFERFAFRGENEAQIAAALNSRGLETDLRRPWKSAVVRQIITNPKYVGTNVFNRRSFKLKRKRIQNPPEMWISRRGAFEPVVDEEVFLRAQAIIQARNLRLSDDQLLERLRQFLAEHGTLSGVLIDETPDMPSSSLYASRFGGLHRAYQLIGWNPHRDFSYVEINRILRQRHSHLIESIVSELKAVGADIRCDQTSGLLEINRQFTASLVFSRCMETPAHSLRWLIRFEASLLPDVTIAVRFAPGNAEILDYYLFPRMDVLWEKLRLAPDNGVVIDLYRFDNLIFFTRLARRVHVEAA